MAASPAAPDTERGTRIEDLPVADTALEPPYRVLVHNDVIPGHLWPNGGILGLVAAAWASGPGQP